MILVDGYPVVAWTQNADVFLKHGVLRADCSTCRHVKDLCGVGANIQGEGNVPLAPTSIGGIRTTMKCAIGSSFAVSMQNSLSGEITAARCFAFALALGGIRIFLEAADYYHRRI